MAGLAFEPALAADSQPPAAKWIPQNSLLVIEAVEPAPVLDLLLAPRMSKAVTSLPIFQAQASQPGFQQFLGLISFLEIKLETKWPAGVRKLLGGGVTFAALPEDAVAVIVDSEDAKLLNELHEVIVAFARQQADNQGKPEQVRSADYRGVTAWTLGPGQAHAIIGNRLVMTNKPKALIKVLDVRANPDGPSLASLPAYQAAKKAAGPDAAATAFLNLGILTQVPNVRKALTSEQNPLVALLLSGMSAALVESNWLALGARVEGDALKINAAVDGAVTDPTGPAAFSVATEPEKGSLPNLTVPRQIASMSLYRDLHGFYAAKDELFPERTSGLIFFENMMGIFFSGRDLTEEVLAQLKPEVRVLVATQDYDPAVGTPGLQIPSFAFVFGLYDPENFPEVAEEAWQAALGLINFTRGQAALPKLIIDKPIHADTKFTTAYFAYKELEDRENIDSRFNFRPSLAKVADYLILSSTESLTKDLIDAIGKEDGDKLKPLAEVHSVLEIDGAELAAILNANRDGMVRNNMVEEGKTREEAEAGIDVLLSILKLLGQARLDVASHNGQSEASLELKLNLPGE